MRRWIVPGVALALVFAIGSGVPAQTPGGDKMDKDKMMDKMDGKMMDKMDKDKMMQKKDDMKMMEG